MMKEIRDAIEEHRYADYKAEKLERMARGEQGWRVWRRIPMNQKRI